MMTSSETRCCVLNGRWCACRLVPAAVIRGIQLAVGLALAEKGITLTVYQGAHLRPLVGADSLWPGLVAAGFIFIVLFGTVWMPVL